MAALLNVFVPLTIIEPEMPVAWAVFSVAPEDNVNEPAPETKFVPQFNVPVTVKSTVTDKPFEPRTKVDVPPISEAAPLKII
ncbi:MAG: hypothetical protein RJA13_1665 [Bacteroidota bacterium]